MVERDKEIIANFVIDICTSTWKKTQHGHHLLQIS